MIQDPGFGKRSRGVAHGVKGAKLEQRTWNRNGKTRSNKGLKEAPFPARPCKRAMEGNLLEGGGSSTTQQEHLMGDKKKIREKKINRMVKGRRAPEGNCGHPAEGKLLPRQSRVSKGKKEREDLWNKNDRRETPRKEGRGQPGEDSIENYLKRVDA